MPITLAGTRITVTYASGDAKGNSFANPWTLEDIAALGYCLKMGSTYIFDSKSLYFDSGYFADTNKNLIFTGTFSDFNVLYAKYNGGSKVKFGTKSGNDYTAGCSFYFDFSIYKTIFFESGNSAEFYGCKFSGNSSKCYNFQQGVAVIEFCSFSQQYTYPFYNSYIGSTLSDVILNDNTFALRPSSNNCSYNRITINKATLGAIANSGVPGIVLRTIKITSDTSIHVNQLSINNQIVMKLVDSDVLTSKITNSCYQTATNIDHISSVELYNSIITKITDELGNALNASSVKIYNKFNNLIADLTSDAQGLTASTDLKKYEDKCTRLISDNFTQVRTYTEFFPFTIVISKQGFQSQTLKLTPSNVAINLVISLKANPPAISFSIRRFFQRLFQSGEPATVHEINSEGQYESEVDYQGGIEEITEARAIYDPDNNFVHIYHRNGDDIEGNPVFDFIETIKDGTELNRISSSSIADQTIPDINFTIHRSIEREFESGKIVKSTETITEGASELQLEVEGSAELTTAARAVVDRGAGSIRIQHYNDSAQDYVDAEIIAGGDVVERVSSSVVEDQEPVYIQRVIQSNISPDPISVKIKESILKSRLYED